jgi:hypothetical protein
MIRGANRLGVVLHDQDRRSELHESLQVSDQPTGVARMQSDCRFIEDVERTGQSSAELRGQPEALHLAAGQALGCSIEAQVVQPDVHQEG